MTMSTASGTSGTPKAAGKWRPRSVHNVKRAWVSYGVERDWRNPAQGAGAEFMRESTQVKNIWVPTGA